MQRTAFQPNRFLALTSILLVVGLAYANSIGNGFAIDDSALVVANSAVHGLTLQNLKAIFFSVPNNLEYLPVRDLTYCLDYAFWGLNPLGYHLTNFVCYAACCVLFYLLLSRLLRWWTDSAEAIAWIATLLFALHPVHVESVAGIAQRKDLVSGIFFLLSVYGYLLFIERRDWSTYALALACFALSLLSKGTVVILPLLVLALEYYAPAGRAEKRLNPLLRALPFAAVAILFVVGQSVILEKTGILKTHMYAASGGYVVRIFTAFKAVMHYIKLLVVPYPLTILRKFDFSRQLDVSVLLSMAGVLLLIFLLWSYRKSAPLLSFCGTWFLICLIPVVGLFPTSIVVAERYLFLPSAGFCLLCGYLAHRALAECGRWGWLSLFVLGVLLVTCGTIVVERNRDWESALTLYKAGVRHEPRSARLNWMVGRELFHDKKHDEAFYYLSRAAEFDPAYGMDYLVFRAIRACETGQLDDALNMLGQIRIPPGVDVVDINYVYGLIFEARGDLVRAEEYYRKAYSGKTRLGIFYQWDAGNALRRLKGKA